MSIVQADHVSFSYGNHQVLRDISLSIEAGEILGLLGPNGTGKSTLLGVLAGDLASSGYVHLGGRIITDYAPIELARMRSVMEQSAQFPFAYRARDIVAMGRMCWGKKGQTVAVSQAMDRIEVTHLAERSVTDLSGGERQRVTFARVLAQDAQVVFLDEPTAALDVAHQERTLTVCRELAAEGRAVIAVMHDIQVAGAYCDRIALMDKGQIRAIGTPTEVLTDQLLSSVYDWPIHIHTLPGNILVVVPARRASSSRERKTSAAN